MGEVPDTWLQVLPLKALVGHLGDPDVQLSEPILKASQHGSLVLQRMGTGEMKFDGEQPDDHWI